MAALLVAGTAYAGEVQVAAAANFAAPLARISVAFTAASGHVLKVSSGATGKFHVQIAGGAPFEVLLAADDLTPKRLIAEGHAVAGSAFTYAIGALALWSARPDFVDAHGAVLGSSQIQRLAIANPKLAPYGAAALQALQALGHADALAPRLVTAGNVAQAYQFVATGNADAGFVALSQVVAPGRQVGGSYWRVPARLHDEIRQDAVLLNAGVGNQAARALLDFLKSDAARQIIRAHGYGP